MNIDTIKKEFPIFDEKIQNNDLVYLIVQIPLKNQKL